VQAIDEPVDGVEGVLLGNITQMSIASGGGGACMAKEGLNMTQAQPPLKQMSGEAVAKGVDRDFFLMPHWLTTAFMAA
jgi:hypothetical protein